MDHRSSKIRTTIGVVRTMSPNAINFRIVSQVRMSAPVVTRTVNRSPVVFPTISQIMSRSAPIEEIGVRIRHIDSEAPSTIVHIQRTAKIIDSNKSAELITAQHKAKVIITKV